MLYPPRVVVPVRTTSVRTIYRMLSGYPLPTVCWDVVRVFALPKRSSGDPFSIMPSACPESFRQSGTRPNQPLVPVRSARSVPNTNGRCSAVSTAT
jgi:hypothetical protein